ncbi:MAG: GHKL domain-containing protein [Bacteroidetes bacterium]|nr:MAG: GHKL domain-containing protein [Bacteroidota bacterium]
MGSKWYTNRWVIILLHTVCWAFIFSLPYLLRPSIDPQKASDFLKTKNLQYLIFINRAILVCLFYFNAFFIVPRFIYKRKFWAYGILLVSLFIVVLIADWAAFSFLITGFSYKIKNFFSFNTFPILFILASSTAYKMINDRVKEDRLQKEKENENLKTELSLLRSQVSPHFMFNIMNNMVALARKGSAQLEPSLIRLSSLLRYMLYETDAKVSLQKEIEYLQSYIDLQKQRFGNHVTIKSCMQNVDKDYEIEPMLLIPFVENAFKHGTGLIENAEIDIELTAKNDMLYFNVRNKYNDQFEITFHNQLAVVQSVSNKSDHREDPKDETPGIGLANVKRRLNLLYAKNHSLLINKKNGWFTISLQLNLH